MIVVALEHKKITRKDQELNKNTRNDISRDSDYKMPKTVVEPEWFNTY